MLADEVRLIDDSLRHWPQLRKGDGTARRKSLGELMAGIDTDRLVISLEHEPRFRGRTPTGVDVMLCGHTHDGQFFRAEYRDPHRVGKPGGLEDGGAHDQRGHVRRGVYGPDMRIGTDADISVVDIQFAP